MIEIDLVAEQYAAAAYAKNEQAFLSLYDENVVVFDMWEEWAYIGRDAWAGMVKGWFNSLGDERVGITFFPTTSSVAGEWAVWCGTVRYAGLGPDDVELRSLENRLSWTLKRLDGAWRIVHEHSSAPADFKTLKVRLSQDRPLPEEQQS